jgi:uncharacterized protein
LPTKNPARDALYPSAYRREIEKEGPSELEILFSQFSDQYTNTADRFIAEGDHVVVQCRGHVTTKSGIPYNNTYCYVCRFGEGKLRELTEYCDTQLIATALRPPTVRQ